MKSALLSQPYEKKDRQSKVVVFILIIFHLSVWAGFLVYTLDLECIFTVICNVVTKSENPDEILEMAKLISTKVAQQPNDKPALRLKM